MSWAFAFLAAYAAQDDLEAKVLRALQAGGGEWGVYFKDLKTGRELAIRADEEFHPASTLKIWVLIKVYQDVHDRKYALDDEVEVVDTFMSAAKKNPKPFKVAAYSKQVGDAVGGRLRIRDLVEAMMTVSDNLATNNLIRIAGGPDAISGCLARYGVKRSNVRRYIMDEQAFQEGLNSAAFPRDFGIIFEKLAKGEVVSRDASRQMLEVMSRCRDRSMIVAGLPRSAQAAHKTGAIEKVRNDAGLVTLPNGRQFVIAFFSRHLSSESAAEQGIAAASKLLAEGLSR